MHFTLHLTTRCNMACGYCYARGAGHEDMSAEVLDAAVDLAASLAPVNAGIVFFGGEPLLRRDLIERAVARCRRHEIAGRSYFHFKLTTNGLLLDDDLLDLAERERIHVGLSIDGTPAAHDWHRRTHDGHGTFAALAPRFPALLARQPYASALMVVTPETVGSYAASVEALFESGFRYVIASLNYAGDWHEEHLAQLEREYRALSRLYERLTLAGQKIYFSPFEKKLAAHIHGAEAVCRRCHFGVRQVSIAPNGDIYPCVQFVQDGHSNAAYCIGDVWRGIDPQRQAELYAASRRVASACGDCALEARCEHLCSCLNWQTTGAIGVVSPLLCVTEQMLIPIVDALGARLYARRAPLFIQKHYNAAYPLISCLEDLALARATPPAGR
jgi:uncharacterized protein